MPTIISHIETLVRQTPLIELSPRFWSSQELTDIIIAGIKDLWRDIVDLKQEHYLTINPSDGTPGDVYLAANSSTLSGVPSDVHKIFIIEALDQSNSSPNTGLQFHPLSYNHLYFQSARSLAPIDPASDTIYYAITGQGSPVGPPLIYCAPQVTSRVNLRFAYVPTLGPMTTNSPVPIPGEADNALLAWTVAFARAKERDDRSPDPNWLAVYSTEKLHLLESLGLRQYAEPTYVDAQYEDYWG